jgi:branched-chain amino acid transport system ATP-binding protein
MALLEVQNLSIFFQGLKAVHDVSFEIAEGEIVGMIGPNGAGKTTIFNLLTNVYEPTEGEIFVEGKSTLGQPAYKMVDMGLARTFQNIRLFKDMSVIDNVKVGFHYKGRYSIAEAVFRLPAYWREEQLYEKRAGEILDIFGMGDMANLPACNLPYGAQRKLEICRAIASGPKLLLLDEPACGMNASETQELMDTIRLVKDRFHTSVLLIEHDMNLVMGICERLIVLNYGQVLAQGDPEEVRNNPEVIRAYLGSEGDPNALGC